MLPPNSWANAPEFQEQQNLVDQEVKSSGLEDETARIAGLDPKTRAFLKKAQDAEELGAKAQGQAQPAGQAPAMSEQAERAQVRQSVTGKVPVDPKGEVLVYFFFRPYDRASLEQVPDIEALYRSLATQPGVTFLGMTFDAMTPPEIENFRKSTNATFPVKNGHRLVTEFGIKQVPTVGLISPNTGKAVFEEHKRSFVYFDELVNIMRGK
jgi:hypothetical protein